MRALRSILYAGWMYGAMAVVGLGGMPVAVFSRRAALWVMRTWSAVALAGLKPICGINLKIEGECPQGPVLIASKHQAMLDTIVLHALVKDPIFVLKRELLSMPVFGWYMRRNDHIAIDRDAGAASLRPMIKAARAHIAAGRTLIIFPEGTRKRPGEALDYKPGVAALYRDLGAPCFPVALNTGLVWPQSGIMMQKGDAVVRFLAPIPPGLDRADFMAELERRIETGLNDLRDVTDDHARDGSLRHPEHARS